ncbi:hypothetical protein JZ751_006178 [Albula glossodonta]|uniref:Uncharacterized protein n=1 Tax=Albula glossodonta TaxID=121402 RepID=A0A8T2MM85_9TELE|nr:hypothetical protein JZ751_006178 [Albula glossodonta]
MFPNALPIIENHDHRTIKESTRSLSTLQAKLPQGRSIRTMVHRDVIKRAARKFHSETKPGARAALGLSLTPKSPAPLVTVVMARGIWSGEGSLLPH